jgi:asparagine synthase (glutamine-hydrolysing)
MCGIAGFLQGDRLHGDAALVARAMATTLTHRGPDDSGIWLDEQAGVALGHQRLAIIDLSAAGHQPMISSRGRYVVAYNGEIYNFEELRAVITSEAGTSWRGHSDTEVLLAAVEHWGVKETLPRLNGMFAFALWDRESRVLTLARDRMGEKPLYYGMINGAFLFGSELKALQAYPGFNPSIDQTSLGSMLRFDYIPAPRTIWQGISKLPAAHYVEVNQAQMLVGPATPYWSLEECAVLGASHPFEHPEKAVDDLDLLLTESVKMRMLADVPVGAFLSGGIDSSLIVALMQRQASQKVKSFTVGFQEYGFDEAPWARKVARALGTDHTELYVTSKQAMDLIPSVAEWWDEPFGDTAQIPTLLLSRLSRRSVKVALSGDGADELFGGYSRFRSTKRAWELLRAAPPKLRRLGSSVLDLCGGKRAIKGWVGRTSQILEARQFEDLYRWRVSRVADSESLLRDPPPPDNAFGPLPSLSEAGEKMIYLDSTTYLPEDILTKVDRASMASSLEVRTPFLDHRIAEFSWRVPISDRITTSMAKPLLRALARRYLPAEVYERKKTGFKVPIDEWLKGPLRSWAEDLLSEQRLARQGLLNVRKVREIWSGFCKGRKHHDQITWNLLMFELWAARNSI